MNSSEYYLKFKSLYEGGDAGKMYADISKAAEAAKAAKAEYEQWNTFIKDVAKNHGVTTSDIIRQLRNTKSEVAQVTQEYSRLDAALGRVGARLGGAAVGQLTGIPGAGFIGSQLGYSLGLTGTAALGLAGAGVGIFAAAEMARHIGTLAEWAQKQSNVSKEIGITVGQMQLLSRISESTGVNVENAAKSISKLSESLIQGGSRGRQITGALSQLGLSSSVAFSNPSQALDQIVGAAAKIADQDTRIRLLTELLGESGRAVAALADRWDELRSKQALISDSNMKSLKDTAESIKELKASWDALLSSAAGPANFFVRLITPTPSQPGAYGGVALTGNEKEGDVFYSREGTPLRIFRNGRWEPATYTFPRPVNPQSQAAADQARRLATAQNIDRDTTIGRYAKAIPDLQAEKTTARSQFVSGAITEEEYSQKVRDINSQINYIQAEGPVSELGKRSQEAYESGYFSGAGLVGRRDAELRKLRTQMQDDLTKYPSRAAEIRSYYNQQLTGTFLKYSTDIENQGQKQFRLFEEAPYSSPEQQKELLRKSLELPEGPFGKLEPGGGLFSTGRGIGVLGPFEDVFTPPAPAGYVTPQEQLRRAQNTGSRLQSLIPLQAQLSGAGGLATTQAEYNQRIHTALAVYDAEKRIAELKESDSDKEKARLDALDKLKQERFDADVDREKSLLQLANEVRSQFAGGFAETILAAQHGQGGRGIRGFFEGQEATILRNIGGLIFNRIGKNIPHTHGQGGLADILKGTIFGDRDENIDKISKDTTRAADDLDTIVAVLTGKYKNGDLYIPGVGNGRVPAPPSIGSGSGPGSALSTLSQISQILYGGGSSQGGYSPSVIMQGFPGSGGVSNGGVFQNAGNWNGGSWAGSPVGVLLSGGNNGDPNVSNVSAMAKAGIQVAAAGIGAWQGISNIARGGGKNIAGGVGELLGAAGMLVPGPAGLALMGAGLVAGLVSGLFGDPRTERAANINRRMFTQQYLAPPSMNLSVGENGGYADVSAFGDVRSSNFSPYPIVQDPYLVNPHRIVVPGGVVSTYGGFRSGTGTYTTSTQNPSTISVTVQAMDAKSFIDHAPQIADALNFHINHSDSGFMKTMNQRFQNRNN